MSILRVVWTALKILALLAWTVISIVFYLALMGVIIALIIMAL